MDAEPKIKRDESFSDQSNCLEWFVLLVVEMKECERYCGISGGYIV